MRKGTKRPLLRIVALFMAMGLVAAACGDDGDEETQLRLGYLLPQTGDLAFLGPPMIAGVEMAVRDINEAGGVLGNDVQLFGADDGTNPDVASAALDRLVNSDRVHAFVGAAASSTTRGIISRVAELGVVECSPSNTAEDLAHLPHDGWYFRTAPPDDLQGPALADVIQADGHNRVAVIALNDEYGQGFNRFMNPRLEEHDIEIVANVAYDPAGATFDADVRQVVDSDPDAVALISFPDTGSRIISAMIEQGIGPADIQIYTADGMQSGSLFELVDEANPAVVEGIKGTAPAAAPEGGAPFFPPAFTEFAPDTDTIFSAHAYDCAIVIALAAHAAGSADSDAIRAEMNNVTRDGTTCSTYADCLALLDDGEAIDYDGASGPLDFTDLNQPSAGTYDIWEFGSDGGVVTLDQVFVES